MKRLVSLMLSVLMLLSVCLTGCFAANDDEWKSNIGTIKLDTMKVTGKGVETDGNVIRITEGGDFEVTGSLNDGMIYVNTNSRVKLRLSGVDITNTTGPAIFFDNADKGFITITADTENILTDGEKYETEDADAALFSNDDLEIKGSGSLVVNGNYKHGIAGDDDVTIENGSISVNSYEHGIKANDTLSISGGDIKLIAKSGKGIKAGADLKISGGTLDVTSESSEGIESKGTLTISGGNIKITAADDGINTGNESSSNGEIWGHKEDGDRNGAPKQSGEMQPPEGKMPDEEHLEGGKNGFDVIREDEAWHKRAQEDIKNNREREPRERDERAFEEGNNIPLVEPPRERDGNNSDRRPLNGGFDKVDNETAAAHALVISGANVYICANGDGIDSNGNLTIEGSTVVIDGSEGNGDGPLDSQGTMVIENSTVITASSAGMLQLPDDLSQNTLKVIFDEPVEAGSEIALKESKTGETVATHTNTKRISAFVVSSYLLKTGTEYTLYVDGEEYKVFTQAEGLYSIGEQAKGFGRGDMSNNMINGESNRKDDIRVYVKGKRVNFKVQPIMKNDTTLVGFRAILEALDADVEWDDETQTVIATKDKTVIKLKIGSYTAEVNGKSYELLAAPELIADNTMVPLRFISERLGMTVNWEEAANRITVE